MKKRFWRSVRVRVFCMAGGVSGIRGLACRAILQREGAEMEAPTDITDDDILIDDSRAFRETLAGLGLSQTGLARLMIEMGDNRSEKNIVRSIQRMVAGDARVSGEMRALLGFIQRAAKPFEIDLHDCEVDLLKAAPDTGGHQALCRRLLADIQRGPGNRVTLTDEQMGELIRYLTRYGSAGFQARLRRAFARPLQELLAPIFAAEES